MGIDCGPSPKRDYPGPWTINADPRDLKGFREALDERNRKIAEWDAKEEARIAAWVEKHRPEITRPGVVYSCDWRLWISCLVAGLIGAVGALVISSYFRG